MAMREQDETPGYEAKSHSPEFLEKAASMSEKKHGKRRVSSHKHRAKKAGKRHERKRVQAKR